MTKKLYNGPQMLWIEFGYNISEVMKDVGIFYFFLWPFHAYRILDAQDTKVPAVDYIIVLVTQLMACILISERFPNLETNVYQKILSIVGLYILGFLITMINMAADAARAETWDLAKASSSKSKEEEMLLTGFNLTWSTVYFLSLFLPGIFLGIVIRLLG